MSAKKILVVDDELGIRELLRDILIDEGFEIFVAENATEARELKKNKTPDLILLDVLMPGLTTKQIVSKITKKIPIIFLTVVRSAEATKKDIINNKTILKPDIKKKLGFFIYKHSK